MKVKETPVITRELARALVEKQYKRPPYIRLTEKVNPNIPCPCGSGKKYKKCCKGADDVLHQDHLNNYNNLIEESLEKGTDALLEAFAGLGKESVEVSE